MTLNGDAPLPFNVHGIEHLILKIPIGHHVSGLNPTVRQGGFPVVDMGDNTEIPDGADGIHLRMVFSLTLCGKKSVDTHVHSS